MGHSPSSIVRGSPQIEYSAEIDIRILNFTVYWKGFPMNDIVNNLTKWVIGWASKTLTLSLKKSVQCFTPAIYERVGVLKL